MLRYAKPHHCCCMPRLRGMPQDLLPLFKCELRHYQLQGVRWMYAMMASGLASVLADERPEDRKVRA